MTVKTSPVSSQQLAEHVHRLVSGYVRRRTEARSGKTFNAFKASGYHDGAYIDANNKVCMDAFLAIRSRKDHADFVNYFTGTLCSVPQFLERDEYLTFSTALLDSSQWENIKSLALLALSSLSQTARSTTDTQ